MPLGALSAKAFGAHQTVLDIDMLARAQVVTVVYAVGVALHNQFGVVHIEGLPRLVFFKQLRQGTPFAFHFAFAHPVCRDVDNARRATLVAIVFAILGSTA